jgi:hypothetical protein
MSRLLDWPFIIENKQLGGVIRKQQPNIITIEEEPLEVG